MTSKRYKKKEARPRIPLSLERPNFWFRDLIYGQNFKTFQLINLSSKEISQIFLIWQKSPCKLHLFFLIK